MTAPVGAANHLLRELPPREFESIEPGLERVTYEHGDVIARPGQTIDYAYFPERGMASVVALLAEGLGAEVATVGNEGMLGLPIFLGGDSSPFHLMWQLEGTALRIWGKDLLRAARPGSRLESLLTAYSQAFFVQTAQNAACNVVHPIQQRGARWLLATVDRADDSEFFLTQEFLAFMLGVTRQSVSTALADLQDRGLIRYRRGHMQILDRRGLEAATCDCYWIIRRETERLLGVGRG